MPDAELRRILGADRARLDALATERAATEHRTRHLREAAAAEHGPQVAALESHRTALREQATRAAEADQIQTDWRAALDRARSAAQERTAAEQDRLTQHAHRIPADLAARITDLRAAEEHAARTAAELAQRAAQLQQELGDSAARQKLQKRAAAVERDYPHARELAQRHDLAAADTAERQLAQLTDRYEARPRGRNDNGTRPTPATAHSTARTRRVDHVGERRACAGRAHSRTQSDRDGQRDRHQSPGGRVAARDRAIMTPGAPGIGSAYSTIRCG